MINLSSDHCSFWVNTYFGNFRNLFNKTRIFLSLKSCHIVVTLAKETIEANMKTRPRNPWHVGPLKVTLFKGKEYYPIPMDPWRGMAGSGDNDRRWETMRKYAKGWETMNNYEKLWETMRNFEKRSEMLRNHEKTWEIDEKHWKTMRNGEKWSKRWETMRSDEKQRETMGNNETQWETMRHNAKRWETIRNN